MKSVRCLFGMHKYSQAEVKVIDEREGYLICRVQGMCVRCGKAYEDTAAIPIPSWLQNREESR